MKAIISIAQIEKCHRRNICELPSSENIFLIQIRVFTVDPQVSGRSDYLDWVMTVQLEYFV